jgi:hypothetical protein
MFLWERRLLGWEAEDDEVVRRNPIEVLEDAEEVLPCRGAGVLL